MVPLKAVGAMRRMLLCGDTLTQQLAPSLPMDSENRSAAQSGLGADIESKCVLDGFRDGLETISISIHEQVGVRITPCARHLHTSTSTRTWLRDVGRTGCGESVIR